MNIHFRQFDRRSQLFPYLLAAFAVCAVMLLILSLSQSFKDHWNMPSASSQAVHSESNGVPVPIPAPPAPAEQIQAANISLPSNSANPIPQVVVIPMPSVP